MQYLNKFNLKAYKLYEQQAKQQITDIEIGVEGTIPADDIIEAIETSVNIDEFRNYFYQKYGQTTITKGEFAELENYWYEFKNKLNDDLADDQSDTKSEDENDEEITDIDI